MIQLVLGLLASAGGGGSGSGGGGSTGVGALMFFVGYGPTYAWSARTRRKYKSKDPERFAAMQAPIWTAGSVYAFLWLALAIIVLQGSFFWFALMLAASAGSIIGVGAGLYNWAGKVKQSVQVKNALQQSALQDRGWNEEHLTQGVKNVWFAFQRDWSRNDAAATTAYLTPWYHAHISLMIAALQQMGRQNNMVNPEVIEAKIIAVNDVADNRQDSFTVGIEAYAEDQLIDVTTNKVIYTNKKSFTEFWDFYRDGDSWRLGGITPSTTAGWTANLPLQEFARNNGFYYSLDWGWLLLPTRGQLFNGGTFGTSDINNHCIGWYQGTYDKILTQLYTYSINPQIPNAYMIAQATLPRNYGNIVVRRRKGLFQPKIKGLKEVSTEWQDFNKMYQVFATSPEQATSLELLNPKYMEQLAAVPFEINVEVVDQALYIYAPLTGANGKKLAQGSRSDDGDVANSYQMLLWALAAAFKEMKM